MHQDVMKTMKWTKVYSDLASAGTNPIQMLWDIPHDHIEILGAYFNVTTPFQGTGVLSCALSLGDVLASPCNQLLELQDAMTTGFKMDKGLHAQNHFKVYKNTDTIYLGIECNVATNNCTQGVVDVYLSYVQHEY